MRAHDLYAGAGGWDVAAAALGVEAGGVENMPEAVATRDAAGLVTLHRDVWTFDHTQHPAEGLIASPPCQTFSMAGKGSGRKALDDVLLCVDLVPDLTLPQLRKFGELVDDARTAHVLAPLWFATHGDYRWLAWEQVPTVLPVWEACAVVLRRLGWHVWTGTLQAEQYGVPQTRKRAVLIASLDREVGRPAPTHSRYHPRTPQRLDDSLLPWVSMAESLGRCPGVTLQSPTHARAYDRSVPRTPAQPAPTLAMGHASASWQWVPVAANEGTTDEQMAWVDKRPSPTVVGSFAPDVVAAPGYRGPGDGPRQKAVGSVRVGIDEASVLQSFPADYPWQGSKSKQFLQVGNAVPPLLALHVLAEATGLPLPDRNTP